MFTFIAFILTMLGSINWLLIGLLQYDFIAGLFGYQGSMFSRIIYIIFGAGAVYFAIRIILNKGSVKVFEKKKKKENTSQQNTTSEFQPAYSNVEAGQENTLPNKKKKWWQFWKRNKKTKPPKQHSQENMQPIDIDINLNSAPEHLNNPPQNSSQSTKDNLFDEHFK